MNIVKVAVCQYKSVPLDNFHEFQNRVNQMFEKVERDAHYVLFPELFNVGLFHSLKQDDLSIGEEKLYKLSMFTEEFIQYFKQKSIDRQQVIIAGSVIEEDKGKYYNTTYIFDE